MRQDARPAPSRPRRTRTRLPAALALAAVGSAALAAQPPLPQSPRDWREVQVAWRDDPRAPVDLPAGGELRHRYPTRRAARRAARRGLPLDGVAVVVGNQTAGSLAGIVPEDEAPRVVITPGRRPPIGVQATLGSPFAPDPPPVLSHRDRPFVEPADAFRRYDLHLPNACVGGRLPLVIWIAGDNAWSGRREACPLPWLVERGYAVACVGYRPAEKAVFPAQLEDCRAAIAMLVREADTWGLDPARVCLIGRGAGGHLAALVALNDPATEIAAACAVAAPADLPRLAAASGRGAVAASLLVGGPLRELREAAQAASPLTHASADDPPLLIVHGTRDTLVPAEQAAGLDQALRAVGAQSEMVLLDAGHDLPLDAGGAAGTAVLAFLDRVLGPGVRGERTAPDDGAAGPAGQP